MLPDTAGDCPPLTPVISAECHTVAPQKLAPQPPVLYASSPPPMLSGTITSPPATAGVPVENPPDGADQSFAPVVALNTFRFGLPSLPVFTNSLLPATIGCDCC